MSLSAAFGSDVQNAPPVEDKAGQEEDSDDQTSTPWYLRRDIKSSLLEGKEVKIPDVPVGAPAQVGEFLTLLAKDYGMEDLMLFDMTRLDDLHEFRYNNNTVDYILIATGKSERHNFKAAAELRNHIKHNHNVIPTVEGMVANGKTPAERRRLLRQARKGASATDNDYGRAANSWVLFHHNNMDVHLMTAERRQELNLESLWCPQEELHMFERKAPVSSYSDHIFSGIRRFHTLTTLNSAAASSKTSLHLQALKNMPCASSIESFTHLKNQFVRDFHAYDVNDFDNKIWFLKTLHCLNPLLVPLHEVENAFYEKHAFTGLGASQKVDDVTEYLKLLIDTPSKFQPSVASTDLSFDRLSTFISNLFNFTLDKFSMTSNPQFIPLLWRLTYSIPASSITPKLVSDIIDQKVSANFSANVPPNIVLSTNNARNVLTLIEYYTLAVDPDARIRNEFKEVVLFTYGNAGKWDRFWKEWESMHFPEALEPNEKLNRWVRLVVFLALASNKAQALHFLNNYWKNSTFVGGSFLDALKLKNGKFNTDAEKHALVLAMHHMIEYFDSQENPAFEGIKATLNRLE